MVDIGIDASRFRTRTIHLDGINNKIEGFDITVQGAYPYGYGDLFGKVGGSVIGHRKNSIYILRDTIYTYKYFFYQLALNLNY
ncbi:hypothetical protein [Polaribacter vadi]|uniref:hypothetical protein n=1 Tax=Polaribacter vadi TaxID=1774273 RepID=UPI0030ECF960|tara:strand:+ start:55139 stop:55387 length:249 start_codon:yes stop_codon:yes gene_type:complete